MSRNSWCGTLPSELFRLVSIQDMNFSCISLTGSLPMLIELISWREIILRRNELTGSRSSRRLAYIARLLKMAILLWIYIIDTVEVSERILNADEAVD